MAKYNYSVTRKNLNGQEETLQVVNCDSFDEAIKHVEKGLRDRILTESDPGLPVGLNYATDNRLAAKMSNAAGPLPSVPDMVVPLDENGNPIQ